MVHARRVLLLLGLSPITDKQKANHLTFCDSVSFEGKRRQATKQCHEKSHGLISYQEIVCVVADGYRSIGDKTLEYVTTVANFLKQRHVKMRGLGRLIVADSVNDPSNSDRTYVESTWYFHKQP